MPSTAEQRRSASGIPFLPAGVTPNASRDAEWRRQAAYGFSGNLEYPNSINSYEKRRSIAGIPFLPPSVTPNLSPDMEWRFEAGYNYAIEPAQPSPIQGTPKPRFYLKYVANHERNDKYRSIR